jgi:hypothetical protein
MVEMPRQNWFIRQNVARISLVFFRSDENSIGKIADPILASLWIRSFRGNSKFSARYALRAFSDRDAFGDTVRGLTKKKRQRTRPA